MKSWQDQLTAQVYSRTSIVKNLFVVWSFYTKLQYASQNALWANREAEYFAKYQINTQG